MKPIVLIAIIVNIMAFIQMGIDKWLAAKGKRRISEIQLIAPTLACGFPGILLGMFVFRHKTTKRSFHFKLAIIVVVFAGLTCFFVY